MTEQANTSPVEGVVNLDEPKKMTREDWRKKKELEEQRKLGNAPAEVDEEGKDINPHIPQYISSVPWYIDPSKRPTLKHQRPQDENQKQFSAIGEWYKRGVQENVVVTKFRKGACENCGAMTHKKKDCLERPRKVGAKFTGTDIAPDEHSQVQLQLDYDGKRDRWNGYDPEEHQRIVEEYAKVDLAKRTLKAHKLQDELASGKLDQNEWEHDSEDEDEDKYADDIDMPGQNFDSKRRITVRNLSPVSSIQRPASSSSSSSASSTPQLLFQPDGFPHLLQHSPSLSQLQALADSQALGSVVSMSQDFLQNHTMSLLTGAPPVTPSGVFPSYSSITSGLQPGVRSLPLQPPISVQMTLAAEPRHCLSMAYSGGYLGAHHTFAAGCFDR